MLRIPDSHQKYCELEALSIKVALLTHSKRYHQHTDLDNVDKMANFFASQ